MEFISRSQAQQDKFIYLMTEKYLGLTNYTGTFLDIGACHPISINNTYELERRGWRGILFELEEEFREQYEKERKSSYVIGDVTTLNWEETLNKFNQWIKQYDIKINEYSLTTTLNNWIYNDNYINYLVDELPKGLEESDTDLLNIRDEMLGGLNKLKYLLTLS